MPKLGAAVAGSVRHPGTRKIVGRGLLGAVAASSSDSNLKQLGLAMIQYTQDYDEMMPPMKDAATAKKALYPYVKSDDVFLSPKTHQPYLPNTSLSHRSLASFNEPGEHGHLL